MKIKNVIDTINSNIKAYKQYAIFSYTKKTYLILLLLEKFCIKKIFIIKNWILVIYKNILLKKKINIKIFSLKNKQNFYTYNKLKKLYIKNKYGIILTNKGACSLNTALKLKQGGVLFCLIYYYN